MRKILFALIGFSALMLASCNRSNEPSSYAGEWLVDPAAIDVLAVDDSLEYCWQIDMWCDGTTISREFEWGTEAEMALAAKVLLELDLKVNGHQTKKVMYSNANSPTEEACNQRVWEGAQCWQETLSGGGYSETNYGWMPAANMEERHNYMLSKGIMHTYKAAAADDAESCDRLNPQEPEPYTPGKDYSVYDSVTYRCWKVIADYASLTMITYYWTTEKELIQTADQLGVHYLYAYAEANDENSCAALEPEVIAEGEEACWKLTVNMFGSESVYYVWGNEGAAEAAVQLAEEKGQGLVTVTYEKAAPEDEDSCNALNN